MARLFGVKLPQVTKFELRSKISKIEKDAKHTLYWHYSEFLLRANRNPWYKNVLNRGSLAAIDGKGLHWAMFKTMKQDFLPWLYGKFFAGWFVWLRMPIFVLLFVVQLVWNLLHGSYVLLGRVNMSVRTKNQVILGREFGYDLLKIAENRGWKTLIIGGSKSGGQVTKDILAHLFPNLACSFWTRPSDSALMRDIFYQDQPQDVSNYSSQQNWQENAVVNTRPQLYLQSGSPEQTNSAARNSDVNSATKTVSKNFSFSHSLESALLRSGFVSTFLAWFFSTFWPKKEILTSENLYSYFPDLIDAKNTIIQQKPDLILVGIGGGSGKQEFFIDSLYTNPEVSFTLATGLGAAFDHLGGGAQQKEAPKWMQKAGLEWLFRFFTQPYRIPRIIDSIGTLWWWTTAEEFMKAADGYRETVVNVVFKQTVHGREFLLARRRDVLPGDVAWSCIQGDISASETTAQAGIRELMEEAGLPESCFTMLHSGIPGSIEDHTISFWRFLVHGAKAVCAHNYINVLEYTGQDKPMVNWENWELCWVNEAEVLEYLSPEKRADFERGYAIL